MIITYYYAPNKKLIVLSLLYYTQYAILNINLKVQYLVGFFGYLKMDLNCIKLILI